MTNMKIERDTAEAIDLFLKNTESQFNVLALQKMTLIAEHAIQDWDTYESGLYAALNKISTTALINYLVDYNPLDKKVEAGKDDTLTKYLKTWTGITSGTFAGRDDGYPETKYSVYDSLNELAKDYKKKKNEKHYKLVEVEDDLEELAKIALKEEFEMERLKEKRRLKLEIERMQSELALIDHAEDND